MPISFLAWLTALTASPSDALGARLKEKVITGNWPWWLTVMGTAMFSVWLKAPSGTWLAGAKTPEDGAGRSGRWGGRGGRGGVFPGSGGGNGRRAAGNHTGRRARRSGAGAD